MAIDIDCRPDDANYYAGLVQDQKFALIPSFTLESGFRLESALLAYKTWGNLSVSNDNVLILCHPLSGSSDAEDWWRPIIGPGKALDTSHYFIFCANMLGSPYGSSSPLTIDPRTGSRYGPDFPATTPRDDVRIQKLLLDQLGVRSVKAVVGGSMGGMVCLEWPLGTPAGYIKSIIPISTSAYHSAWGISWSEAQRNCIRADASYLDGWYHPHPSTQPILGLGTARMVAILTCRTHTSFEKRFSRKSVQRTDQRHFLGPSTPPSSESEGESRSGRSSVDEDDVERKTYFKPDHFAAQKYMQYQADKFLKRFDANCYMHLMQKMDAHDVTRGRVPSHEGSQPTNERLAKTLQRIPSGSLVISVHSDILFPADQQIQLADALPGSKFVNLDSRDGHDGFLLEFDALNALIIGHLQRQDDKTSTAKLEEAVLNSSSLAGYVPDHGLL